MKAALDHVEEVAANIRTFWFRPERPARYVAGQFTELRLPHDNEDSRGNKRWFTLSSSPTEELLSITTKYAGDNSSSFKKALFDLKPGNEVTLADPMGDFVLPKDASVPLVFVAGGIGVTPMRSMVKYVLDSGEKRDIQLIYAANSLEEVAFRDLFEQYGLKPSYVINNPPPNWNGQSGKLSPERILSIAGDLNGKLSYFAGPEPMVESFLKGLKNLGVNKHRLVADYFPNYTQI